MFAPQATIIQKMRLTKKIFLVSLILQGMNKKMLFKACAA